MMYSDRMHAAHIITDMLERENAKFDVVVSLMRGAIPIACVIAEKQKAELILMPIKKIGPDENEEYAIACVSEHAMSHNPSIIIPVRDTHLFEALGSRVANERNRILQMKNHIIAHYGFEAETFFDYKKMNMKKVLIVDDGIATGTTLMCAIAECRMHGPVEVSVCTPVSSKEAYEMITSQDIKIYCPFIPETFIAVGQFYDRFSQVTEDQIVSILRGFTIRKQGLHNRY